MYDIICTPAIPVIPVQQCENSFYLCTSTHALFVEVQNKFTKNKEESVEIEESITRTK